MIPEAVFREFPAKTIRKLAVTDRKMPGIRRRNPAVGSGSLYRNTASMKSPEPAVSVPDCSTWVSIISLTKNNKNATELILLD
jgi:hypothetical protein